jgi:hypothetical protein
MVVSALFKVTVNIIAVLGAKRSHNFGKRLLASSCPSVLPSVLMEQLGFYWTDFREI